MTMTADQLFEENLGLVFKVCDDMIPRGMRDKRLKLNGLSDEDMEQKAKEGLWKACVTYKNDSKAKFGTYAYKVIKSYIFKLINHSFSVKYPYDMNYSDKIDKQLTVSSLNFNIEGEEGEERELIDILDLEDHIDFDLKTEIQLALNKLNPRERYVVNKCVMLDRPIEEVGRSLGITHQAVSYYKRSAFKKLREYLYNYA